MTTTRTAEIATAPRMTEIPLPPFCGQMSDMNRDQKCARAARIYQLRGMVTDIERERTRIPRLRGRNAEWRKRNLAAWAEEAETRLGRIAVLILSDLPECTHPEDERREILDVEEALPPCTC